jgi:hypothetical protein
LFVLLQRDSWVFELVGPFLIDAILENVANNIVASSFILFILFGNLLLLRSSAIRLYRAATYLLTAHLFY